MYNIIENLINVYTDIIDIYILRYIYRFILINDKKQKNKIISVYIQIMFIYKTYIKLFN